MNIAGAPVIGAALLVVCIAVLYVYFVYRHSDTDSEERMEKGTKMTTREIALRMVVRFGGVTVIIALGTAVGVLVWDLQLAAVGLYGNPGRELAFGLGIGPVFAVFSYYFTELVEYAGLESQGNVGELITVETLPELGWMLGGLSVQASAEEVYFRAALVGAPATLLSVSAWYFVVPSALLFGLLHGTGGKVKIFSTSIQGVILGAVFVVGGIIAAAAVHVLNNQITAVQLYRKESSSSSSSGVTPDS